MIVIEKIPNFEMDVVANSNLPEEEKEKLLMQRTGPTENLLSKRKKPEINSN